MLDNGLLNIELRRPVPERNVRTVEIKPGAKGKRLKTIDLEPQNQS